MIFFHGFNGAARHTSYTSLLSLPPATRMLDQRLDATKAFGHQLQGNINCYCNRNLFGEHVRFWHALTRIPTRFAGHIETGQENSWIPEK
jgi:hypothetical protein